MRGVRGEFAGTFRSSPNRWGLKVWVDGSLHYLGGWSDRAAAAAYGRLVESRYPHRLSRKPGGVWQEHRERANPGKWYVI